VSFRPRVGNVFAACTDVVDVVFVTNENANEGVVVPFVEADILRPRIGGRSRDRDALQSGFNELAVVAVGSVDG
jgi:hypothetical protein